MTRICPSARSFLLACGLLLPLAAAAAGPVGRVTNVGGLLVATRADGASRILAANSPVEQGDVLVTGESTYAAVRFSDRSEVTLKPRTQLRIDRYAHDPERPQEDSFVASLLKGGLRTITGLIGKTRPDAYRMQTGTATIGIRGTGYGAQLCQGDCAGLTTADGRPAPDGLHVDVFDGAIVVSNQGGIQEFRPGEFGFVPNQGLPPVKLPQGNALPPVTPPPPRAGAAGAPGTAGGTCVVQ